MLHHYAVCSMINCIGTAAQNFPIFAVKKEPGFYLLPCSSKTLKVLQIHEIISVLLPSFDVKLWSFDIQFLHNIKVNEIYFSCWVKYVILIIRGQWCTQGGHGGIVLPPTKIKKILKIEHLFIPVVHEVGGENYK